MDMLMIAIVGVGARGRARRCSPSSARPRRRPSCASSLRQLEDYEVENVRDQELLDPLTRAGRRAGHRAGSPAWASGSPRSGYVDTVRTKLISAGKADQERSTASSPIRVHHRRRSSPIAALPRCTATRRSTGIAPAGCSSGCVALVFVLGPDAILNRQVEERQHEIRTQAARHPRPARPSASRPASASSRRSTARSPPCPGPLSEEFARMLGEVRAGASRADAMRALDARTNVPEVRSFVLAILQADTFGVSIGRVLRAQADEMRIKRRQLAQEQAQKAPVKMLIPMVFCIFPALFVVVLGPAASTSSTPSTTPLSGWPRTALPHGRAAPSVERSASLRPPQLGRRASGSFVVAARLAHRAPAARRQLVPHPPRHRAADPRHRARCPSHDPYTFTAPGEPWVVQSWLASLLYASAERLGGPRRRPAASSGVLAALLAGLGWRLLATGGRRSCPRSRVGGAVPRRRARRCGPSGRSWSA